jgi:hypothetical protein
MQHQSFAPGANDLAQLFLQRIRIGQAELGNRHQPGSLRRRATAWIRATRSVKLPAAPGNSKIM